MNDAEREWPRKRIQDLLPQVRDHWSRFILHEQDFRSVVRHIPLLVKHACVSSDDFVSLGLKTGSMIETSFKRMAKAIDYTLPQNPTIVDYIAAFEEYYALSAQEVRVKLNDYGIVTPFEDFKNKKSPSWWQTYSQKKHDYDLMFKDMTLRQCVLAMTGLFLLNVYPIECREHLGGLGVIYDSLKNTAEGLFGTLKSDEKILRGPYLSFVGSIFAETTCFRFEFTRLQREGENAIRRREL